MWISHYRHCDWELFTPNSNHSWPRPTNGSLKETLTGRLFSISVSVKIWMNHELLRLVWMNHHSLVWFLSPLHSFLFAGSSDWLNEAIFWGLVSAVLLPPANEVWGKVIFSQACVKNSVRGGAWSGGCLLPGARSRGGPGSQPREKLRGIRSRPTPKGGNWGGSGPGPHPRGKLRGIRSRPIPKGGNWGGQVQSPPMATAAGSTHPTGMHSCDR